MAARLLDDFDATRSAKLGAVRQTPNDKPLAADACRLARAVVECQPSRTEHGVGLQDCEQLFGFFGGRFPDPEVAAVSGQHPQTVGQEPQSVLARLRAPSRAVERD